MRNLYFDVDEMGALRNQSCKAWFDHDYGHLGFAAQRLYPNEELLRFFGRHYFLLPRERRHTIRILEAGCGSGANLWMIAREGFDAHGVELSPEGAKLCAEMLDRWQTRAKVEIADMTAMPYADQYFDAIVDVYSSYCLDERGFSRFIDEVARLLKPGGRFFSYAPSKGSDSFLDPGPSRFIDGSTLDGIRREGAAYFGSFYPFRFIAATEYAVALENRGLRVIYNETVGRT